MCLSYLLEVFFVFGISRALKVIGTQQQTIIYLIYPKLLWGDFYQDSLAFFGTCYHNCLGDKYFSFFCNRDSFSNGGGKL